MLEARSVCVHAGRDTEQATGGLHRIGRPFTADAFDHPAQDRPQIAIDPRFVDRFKCGDDAMDFHAGWKGFAASPDEDQCIDRTGRHLQVTRPREADAIEIEYASEECAELGIMAKAVLGQYEREPLAVKRRLRNDRYHASRRRKSMI